MRSLTRSEAFFSVTQVEEKRFQKDHEGERVLETEVEK